MNNIILVGMPGSGKSTVGVILAKTLGMDFVDTDLIICKKEGTTLQKIIENSGLEYFEKAENSAGCELECSNTVVATGGSMVLYEEAMRHLKEMGKVVFIDVELSELQRRITNITTRGITFKKGETLADVYAFRRSFYENYADITIKISSSALEETVEKIISKLNL